MMTFAESLFQKIPTVYYQLFYDECEPVWIINSEEVQLVENVPQYYPPLPDPPKPAAPPPKPEAPAPTVVKVPMCCDACEDRVYSTFKNIKGVEKISCDWTEQKVVVTGPVSQQEVLAACRKMFKHSTLWK